MHRRVANVLTGVGLVFGVVLPLVTTTAFGQDNTGTAVPISGTLQETFDTAKVSASTLVGVRLGVFKGFVDVEQVVIALPDKKPTKICVQIRTQDARYSALNQYQIGATGVFPKVKLSPVTERFQTKLEGYKNASFAVKSYVPEQGICNPFKAMVLPQVSSAKQPIDSFVAFINSESRAAIAELYTKSNSRKPVDGQPAEGQPKPIARAVCEQHNKSAAVAFDRICKLTIPANTVAGPVFLRILLDDGFAVEPQEFSVFLPSLKKLTSNK